jgi:hypothetical protein
MISIASAYQPPHPITFGERPKIVESVPVEPHSIYDIPPQPDQPDNVGLLLGLGAAGYLLTVATSYAWGEVSALLKSKKPK